MDTTITGLLDRKAAANGDRVAVEFVDGGSRTYSELRGMSASLVNGLRRQLGIVQGDRVAVVMANRPEFLDTWFSLLRLGAVEVPINTANRGTTLSYVLNQSGARVVVCDEEFLDRVLAVAPDCASLRHLVVRGLPQGAGSNSMTGLHVHDIADLYTDGPELTGDSGPSFPASILYTSGTTGPPKGALLPQEYFLAMARHTAELCRYGRDDRLYTMFPLFHAAAKCTCLLAGLTHDATVLLGTRFSPATFLDTLRENQITAFNYQGVLLTLLMKQPERPDDADNALRVAFGAPAPAEIWERFEQRFGLTLIDVYGMTEIGTALANTFDDRRVGSCGKPVPHFDVEIHDESDNTCPPGVPGEIVVRPRAPDVMFQGYYSMADTTLEAFRNLWFHTGDRGKTDEDGFFYFVDRQKDAIRRRGENISSFEIERTVNAHDAVLECAAYGLPSELTDEDVAIAVVLKDGARCTAGDLLDFCQDNLPHFSVPRYVRFTSVLPKTPSERVQKHMLRAEGVTAETWDRDAHGYDVRR